MSSVGMIIRSSPHDGATTADQLRRFVEAHDLKVFARIDHDCAAADVGLELPFTQVLIFGNPRAGTPLMRHTPSLAIDLPLRVLVWQDAAGYTWVGYDDPEWVAARHGMLPDETGTFAGMVQLLAKAAEAAIATAP